MPLNGGFDRSCSRRNSEKLYLAAYLLENETARLTLGYRKGVDSRMNSQPGDISDNKVLVFYT